jgi:hypothetical protein
MITHAGIVNQEIDPQTAFVQPIAETFQLSLVAKIQGPTELLKIGVDRLKFGFERLQAPFSI